MRRVGMTVGVVACVALLASCGGGGGGGGNGSGSGPVSITAENQEEVAAAAGGSALFLADVADLGAMMAEGLGGLPAASRQAARSAAVLVPEFCDSGTLDVAIQEAAPAGQLSVGDSAVATFSACVISDGIDSVLFDGTVTLVVADAAAGSEEFPTPPFDVAFEFDFRDFQARDDASTTTVDGGFTMGLASDDGVELNLEVSGTSLSVREQGDAGTFSAELTAFQMVASENLESGAYTVDARGTVRTSDLGGSVTYGTTSPFQGAGEDYPHAGEMVVTGADSTLTLTAVSSSEVMLELDADGDGEVDEGGTTFRSWESLDL